MGKKGHDRSPHGQNHERPLGSDRRLKTIYRVNMCSAFQKGQYDRAMASDMHPYLLYRLGNSRQHREEHVAWEGIILPKTDPWWDSHFPPNDWGCNCFTVAVTEERKRRYEAEGIPTAPRLDGTGGGNVPAKTAAPPPRYRNYFNERKGTVERVPVGVSPAFNWNQGAMGRRVSTMEHLVTKTQEKMPEQFDLIMSSLIWNSASKAAFYGFVDDALSQKRSRQLVAPVGFLDSRITGFLGGKGRRLGDNSIVVLESRLVNGRKFTGKHARMGNALAREDWYNLLDWLMDAQVYWDGRGLVYLAKLSGSRYMKIAVDTNLRAKSQSGVRLMLPKVDTMYVLDLSAEGARGMDEYGRIMRMERIR